MSTFDELAALEREMAAGTPEGQARAVPIDDPERGAGFWPRWNASWADNPQARMEQFAKHRPGMQYRIDPQTGGIAYFDPQTKEWYLEEPSGLGNTLLGAAAEVTGGGLPAEVGGLLGSLAGPLGSVLGASGGEAAKQGVQAIVDPRERGLMEAAARTGFAGLTGAAGEGLGALGRRVMARTPGLPYDPAQAAERVAASREFDIPLFPSEVTGNREIIGMQSLLHDSPRTGQIVNEALGNRQSDIDAAVNRYLNEVSPYNGPFRADEAAAQAAVQARDQMVAERSAAARPLYEQAAQDVADPSRTIGLLDQRIAEYPETSGTARQLRRMQRLLTERDADGNAVPISSVNKLHAAKTEIDDMIERAQRAGDNNLARELTQAQRELLGDIETGSPSYGQARQTYADESRPINEFDATLVGQAEKTFTDPTYRMSKRLFSAESSPFEVGYARDMITEQSPEAWNALVRGHLQRSWDELKGSAVGNVDNVGGMFRKAVYGNNRQRKQMRIALGDERYKKLDRLMDVLESTGISSRGQSMTEPRQQFRKQIERQGTPWTEKLTSPYDWFNEGWKERKLDDLYRGLVNVVMSDSRSADFSIDRAINEINKYQGKVPAERSAGLQSVFNLILQAGAQQGMMGE